MKIPTVRVASPADPSTYIVINESDLTEDHQLWPEQAPPEGQSDDGGEKVGRRVLAKLMADRVGVTADEWRALPLVVRIAQMQTVEADLDKAPAEGNAPRVAKGARGLWYGFRGKERVTPGCASEAEAQAALDGLNN